MDSLNEFEVGKRRKTVIYYAAAAAACLLLMIVVIVSSEYDDLGLGTTNNNVVNWSLFFALALSTVAMVKSCRLRTPKSGITHWKRVGLFALILWGSVVVLWLAMFLSPVILPFSVLILAMYPSLIWFPIWTGVSAIRGSRNPDRLIPMRVGGEATSKSEPIKGVGAPVTPTLGHPDSSTVTESEAVPVPQASDPGGLETVPGVVGKRKRPKGLTIGAIVLGFLIVGVGGYVLDQFVQSREMSAILDVVEKSESQNIGFMKDMDAIITKLNNGSLTQEEAVDQVVKMAPNFAIEMILIRRDISARSIWPWHAETLSFREDYQGHMDAWIHRIEGSAVAEEYDDLVAVYRKNEIPISTSWGFAQASALGATPLMFAGDLPKRVKSLFFSSESSD